MHRWEVLDEMVSAVRGVEGVLAVVLGGSQAIEGAAHPGSDLDVGLYYRGGLDVEAVRRLAAAANDTPDPVVTELGGWGPWVNGGAWLTVRGQRLDLIYRDLDRVEATLDDCEAGELDHHYYQQPPYGFHSYIYGGELFSCRILHDPQGIVAGLKRRVASYPPALRRAILQRSLWQVEFALHHGKVAAERGQRFIVAGCLGRAAQDLVQAVYALNRVWFVSEKRFYFDAPRLAVQPPDFAARLDAAAAPQGPGTGDALAAVAALLALRGEVAALADEEETRSRFAISDFDSSG